MLVGMNWSHDLFWSFAAAPFGGRYVRAGGSHCEHGGNSSGKWNGPRGALKNGLRAILVYASVFISLRE